MPPDLAVGHETDDDNAFEVRPAGPISLGPVSSMPLSLGPVSLNTRSKYDEAHRLACTIEDLLTPADPALMETEGYGPRLARALARSLIDHLADMKRSRVA